MSMETNKFKVENWITVPGFAVVELGLSGNELLCYSLVYGFTQDKETEFKGSLTYIASALNVTKQNAKKIIDRLIERGLIDKHEIYVSGVKFCHYMANRVGGVAESATGRYQNDNGGVAEIATGGVAESATNNTNIDKSIDRNNKPADGGLFDGQPEFEPITVTRSRRTSENLCIFENSKYADYKLFAAEFNSPEFNGVDIVYYYHVVSDWSASKGAKKHDWIATARNFMRKDMESGKLHKLNNTGTIDPDAMEYLKMMSE